MTPRRRARCNLDGGQISAQDQQAIDQYGAFLREQPRRPRGALPTKRGLHSVEYGSVVLLPGGGISVVVLGKPAPQGSKGPLGMEDNPRTKPWREAIFQVCTQYKPADVEPLDGALALDLVFYFDPPRNARRGDLPITRATYDWDKLSRAMGDGLTAGRIIVDDARIVDATVRKRYVWPGDGEARAVAVVTAVRSP